MTSASLRRSKFLELHHGDEPFLLGNAWDAGSARILSTLGYQALATTSAGAAMRVGKLDYEIDLDASITSAVELVEAVDIPVSVDFEDGFSADPSIVAANLAALEQTGVAGCSIEDFTRDRDDPIYELEQAVDRVAAAAAAAHAGAEPMVLTARTEVLSAKGRGDLADVITRLQRFQDVGADVLFAPGLRETDDIAAVVAAVDRPVSIMALPGIPSVPELAALGVARVSVAAWFTYAAYEGLRSAATEVLDNGTFDFMAGLGDIRALAGRAFGS